MMPKRLHLVQGSDEWLQWRRRVIGSSDAPVIMGETRWKDVDRLLLEKLGRVPEFQGNALTRRGLALEPIAREHYQRQKRVQVAPAVLEHMTRLWQVVSVDGISARGTRVVEIKCGEKAYEYTHRHREPPPYYVGQLQHILAVAELDVLDFYCYLPGERPLSLVIGRDERYIRRLLVEEERFLEMLRSSSRPAPPRSRPHIQVVPPTISTPPPPVTAPISAHRSSRDEQSAAENERARDHFVGAVILGVLFTIGLTALVMLLQAVGSTP